MRHRLVVTFTLKSFEELQVTGVIHASTSTDNTNSIIESISLVNFIAGNGLDDFKAVIGISEITTKEHLLALLNFQSGENQFVIREGEQMNDNADLIISFTRIKGVDRIYVKIDTIDVETGEPISIVAIDEVFQDFYTQLGEQNYYVKNYPERFIDDLERGPQVGDQIYTFVDDEYVPFTDAGVGGILNGSIMWYTLDSGVITNIQVD